MANTYIALMTCILKNTDALASNFELLNIFVHVKNSLWESNQEYSTMPNFHLWGVNLLKPKYLHAFHS